MRPRISESHPGLWNLVEEPDRQIAGVLQIDASGRQTLELIGELRDPFSKTGARSREQRIFGAISENNGVTLSGCFVLRSEGLFGPIVKQVWHANEAVFGLKFDSHEPWSFYGAEYVIPGLNTWVQRAQHGFTFDKNERGLVHRVAITSEIESWPLWSFEDGAVDLRKSVRTSRPYEGVTEIESTIAACGSFGSLQEPDKLHRRIVRPLQVLLGLATTEFTGPVAAKASVDLPKEDTRGEFARWHREPLDIEISPMRLEYAFHYSDFAALNSTQQWIQSYSRLDAIWGLFLAALKRAGPLEMRFLFVMQALEAFHRLSIPLPTGNQKITLRQRLLELLDKVGPSVDAVCGKSRQDFVTVAKDARNYFTHWDTASTPHALDNEQLVYLTWRLLTVLELLIAAVVGFKDGSDTWKQILSRRIRRIPP